MTGSARFTQAFVALAVLGAGLAATLHLALDDDTAEPVMPATVSRPSQSPTPAGPTSATADRTGTWVAAMLSRPLFDPHRRPPISGGELAGEGLPRLAGVLVGPFGRSAIFAGPTGGKSVVVTEGDRLDGYVIEAIRPTEVTVLGPEGRRVLHPTFEPDVPPVRGTPVAAMPGVTLPAGLLRTTTRSAAFEPRDGR